MAEVSPDSTIVSMFHIDRAHLRIPDIDDTYGVAFRDVNGDEWPDIFFVCFRGLNRLLVNQGPDYTFSDLTIQSGLGGNLMPMDTVNLELGTVIVDFDNDGDGDVIITGWGSTTNLYQNNGRLSFQNISPHLNLPQVLDANGCVAADINRDGHVDLFMTDEHYSNRMLLNQGDGTFQDFTEQSGLAFSGTSQGAGFCDVDNDGDSDLYVCNWFGPDLFYCNLGDGKFKRLSLPMEVCQESESTNGVSFSDIDNDGDFDVFVTNRQGRNYLYRNDSAPEDTHWVFINVSEEAHLIDAAISYGSVIGDFDNDGWQDIFVTNVGPNQLYLNSGDGTFEKVFEEQSLHTNKKTGYSTGAACGDYDGDGDLDLVVANKDTFSLFYINPTNNHAYIKFRVHGIKSNRDGIGARIKIYTADHLNEPSFLLGTREIVGGGGYFSQNEPLVHFGLDTVRFVDAAIHFPSGKVITQRGLRAGQSYTIFEHPILARTFILFFRHLLYLMKQAVFWYESMLILLFLLLTYILTRLGLRRYRWTSRTATGYIAGFFTMAFIVLLSLQKMGLLTVLLSIDILTITFVLIFMINSERLYRLRQIKDKYRSVLIQLSHQIIHLHDDGELITTVVENIQYNTEFDFCCSLIYDDKKQRFARIECRGLDVRIKELNKQPRLKEWIERLRERSYLTGTELKGFDGIYRMCPAHVVMSIQRDEQFYGCLIMGGTPPVPRLTLEDIELFKSITNQMAVALENNAYIRHSNEMIQELTEANVQKKYLQELEEKNRILDGKNHELEKLYDELKNTEAQLIHSEKMASLGQLVAGISHELNNPVGYIYANIKQLKSYIHKIETFLSDLGSLETQEEKDDNLALYHKAEEILPVLPDIHGLINDTIQGSQMVKGLVHNLRTFSQLDQAEWKKADIHDGIETCLMILTPELKDRIQVHKKYDASGMIECNIGQLNQVFLNLLVNGAHAIEGDGNIRIKTTDRTDAVEIEIQDDGKGIPEKILGKIFDPFFTTKEVGRGIGLGLSISYSIVKNHNGRIEVESVEGEGSTFRVILPAK